MWKRTRACDSKNRGSRCGARHPRVAFACVALTLIVVAVPLVAVVRFVVIVSLVVIASFVVVV